MFWAGKLAKEESGTLLEHIQDCDECLVDYALWGSAMAKKEYEERSIFDESEKGCPTPGTMCLLLDGKLEADEQDKVLRHIMDCDDCAVEYGLLKALQKADETEQEDKTEQKVDVQKRGTRIIPFWNYFQKAAAVLLLIGFGYWSGVRFPYNGDGTGERDPGSPFGLPYRSETSLSAAAIEKSSLYQHAMNNVIWKEIRSNLPGGSDSSLPDSASFREETHLWENIEKKKRDFDERLSAVLKSSGVAADIALTDYGVDLLSLTSENLSVFARLLKEGREMDINYAREWISLDQNLYFSLVDKIPQDVWDRYTPDKRSFEILSWIASLPPAEREKMWKFTGEQAEKEFLEQRNQ
jgi:hypothetical protein